MVHIPGALLDRIAPKRAYTTWSNFSGNSSRLPLHGQVGGRRAAHGRLARRTRQDRGQRRRSVRRPRHRGVGAAVAEMGEELVGVE